MREVEWEVMVERVKARSNGALQWHSGSDALNGIVSGMEGYHRMIGRPSRGRMTVIGM